MSDDLIRYDILTQDALRLMVAKLLDEVARTGLPGEHHFFITFDTCAPNVQLSARMKQKYPDEMTIVVQHRFWQLEVSEDHFQIGLSFDEIPETLVVPFAAIKGFYDPSVKFGLQFEVQVEEDVQAGLVLVDEVEPEPSEIGEKPKKKRKPSKKQKAKNEPLEEKPVATKTRPVKKASKTEQARQDEPEEEPENETGGAQVVSLDSFRKKK